MSLYAALRRSPVVRALARALRRLVAAWAHVLRLTAHRGRPTVTVPTVAEGDTVVVSITHRADVHVTPPDGWAAARAEAAGRDAVTAMWAQVDGAPWR